MFSDPNFGSVVLEKQWRVGLQTGFDTGPGESAVSLINKIDGFAFEFGDDARRKNQVVSQVKGRARAAQGLGIYQCQSSFIKTGDVVVADDTHVRAQLSRRVDETVYVSRRATGMRARARRAAQVSEADVACRPFD